MLSSNLKKRVMTWEAVEGTQNQYFFVIFLWDGVNVLIEGKADVSILSVPSRT